MSALNRFLFGMVPLLIFVLLSWLLLKGLHQDPKKIPSVLINKPAPDFQLKSLLGDRYFTQTVFQNKITLLNVWATWCLTCRADHAFWSALPQDPNVQLIGFDYKDDPKTARDWLHQLGNPYQLVLSDPTGSVAIDYGVYGTPETFVVDQKGRIRFKWIGPLDTDRFQQNIAPVIHRLQKEGAKHA